MSTNRCCLNIVCICGRGCDALCLATERQTLHNVLVTRMMIMRRRRYIYPLNIKHVIVVHTHHTLTLSQYLVTKRIVLNAWSTQTSPQRTFRYEAARHGIVTRTVPKTNVSSERGGCLSKTNKVLVYRKKC